MPAAAITHTIDAGIELAYSHEQGLTVWNAALMYIPDHVMEPWNFVAGLTQGAY
jgi:hypothetical protein